MSELDPVEEVARLNHDHEWRPMSLNLADAVECVCGAVREARGVGVVVSGDQLDLDAWEREADRAVAWGIVHDHPERIVALVAEVRRLRAQVVDMVPGRWWRVLDAEGDLWLETSREQEARDSMKDDPQAAALERLWAFPREAGEWRAVE